MTEAIRLSPGIERIPAGSLYPHQADGVAFLLSKKRVVLADDMGLGKTRQAIVALEVAAPDGVILVVCPASLKLNWKREILLVDPDARIEVFGVDKDPVDNPRWVVVNYDIVGKHAERLHAIEWTGVILDEAHFIKNASRRTSHCLKLLGVQNDARAPLIGPEYVFLLTGKLGAGKTCLAQGIAHGLDINEYAASPSFVLVRELNGRLSLYHVDLYRLDRIEEIADLGLDDYLYGDGVCVVEWAEKGLSIMPDEHLSIGIDYISDTERTFKIEPMGKRYRQMVAQLKRLPRDFKASL